MLLEVRTQGPADLALMRSTLGELDLGEISLQTAGADDQVMIRAKAPEGDEAAQRAAVEQIKGALDAKLGGGLSYQRAEFVGPRVSQELLINSVWAVLISLLGVLLYLWFRFEWQYGIGAIASLIHDVSATIGIYALSGIEFNLTSVAAVLTIVGYSLNDTVVIYDRVRENLRRYKALPLDQLLDRSINETLARTLMTSLTTLVALIALWLFGGEVIRGFTDHHDLGRGHRHLLDDLHRHAGALLPQPAHRRRQAPAGGRSSRRADGPARWRRRRRQFAPGLQLVQAYRAGGFTIGGRPSRRLGPGPARPGAALGGHGAGGARRGRPSRRCARSSRRPTSWWSVPVRTSSCCRRRCARRCGRGGRWSRPWRPPPPAAPTTCCWRGAPGRRGPDRAAAR